MPGKLRVLVIDDDPSALALFKARFEATGVFQVLTARNGRAGVALARHERPDAILCDILMPEMGGEEVAQELATHRATRQIPFMFLTALVKPEEVSAKGGLIGGWPMASKLEAIEALVERIEDLIARRHH